MTSVAGIDRALTLVDCSVFFVAFGSSGLVGGLKMASEELRPTL